jgi:hypothetical protein
MGTIVKKRWKSFIPIILTYIGFLLCAILTAWLNYEVWGGTPFFTLIELRNVIRFPVFFFAVITFFQESEIEKVFKILTIFFYLNFIMIIYQYFTFRPANVWTRGDYLNGFFGTSVGGNTYVNALMLCVVIYWLCKWKNKECNLWNFLLPLMLSILVAALIELKAFFFEVGIIFVCYLMSCKKNQKEFMKNIGVVLLVIMVAFGALQLMYLEYPWFKESMSLTGMLKLASESTGYTSTGDLNRLTGIFTISTNVFQGNILEILFGIGLGNGAVYSLGGMYTTFCTLYEQIHYSWFSSTYLFVQCGFIGLSLYVLTFLILFLKKKNLRYQFLTSTMIILALFLIIYNETLKTDAGYLIYFAIASGYVICHKKEQK